MIKRIDTALSEELVAKGMISKSTAETLLEEAAASEQSLLQHLVKRGMFQEKDLLALLAERMGLVCIDLKKTPVKKDVIEKVPVKIATYYKFVPLSLKDRTLTIAVFAPLDIKTQDEIRTQLGYDIEMVLAGQNDIYDELKRYYGFAADTLERIVSRGAGADTFTQEFTQATAKVEDIEKMAGDASVIKLVNQIILEAYRKRATDIHIEPYRNGVSLRYRTDGILYDTNVAPEIRNFLNAIISRIKIMSNLNIVERRMPQDGRAIVRVQDQVLDLRISTIPTPYGESVVIRILPAQMLFSLEKLGLSKKYLLLFETLIQKPHGIIFVTGPTGSGKTTTLYASLNRINTKERKIITIEDPIEYEMPGITQIQVMPEIGLDFARGLRSILRHDPDVIMVGEVRDLETAEIAIRVALTGHLVFSTLHTNDAASGVTRLVDIGLEPYLVASSVEAFIAQRLIRLICPDCKYEDEKVPIELKDMIAKESEVRISEVKIFRGKGCPGCNFSGFYGRTAIYEILMMNEAIKDLVLKKVSASHIKHAAIAQGMRTLRQDGWHKVILGVTTPEEVMRVASADEQASPAGKAASIGLPSAEPTGYVPPSMDKRAYRRLDNKLNVQYRVFEKEEDVGKADMVPQRVSYTKNISASGALFYSDESFLVGSILDLSMDMPDGKGPVQCLARIVRVEEAEQGRKYTIAACFLDITSAQKARLEKYIESQP